MSFPTIPTAAGNTLLSSTTSTASTTHTFPSLTTLAPAAGDLLIAICVQYQGGSANAEFSSWGASFTETKDDATVTALDQAIGVAHKIATGSESGTFTVTSAHSFKSVNFLMSIPAATWHGTTIPEVLAVVRATGAVADPGSFTPSWAATDTLWISVYGHSETSTTGSPPTVNTAPTNYSGALIVARAADAVGDITAGVAFRQLNALSEDVGTWAASNATRGNGAATVIAIRPAKPSITDTGLTITDSIAFSKPRVVTDTGLTITDRIAPVIQLTDTAIGASNWWTGVAPPNTNGFGFATSGGGSWALAEAFIPSANMNVDTVQAWLKKVASPIDGVQIQIQSDSSGKPSNSVIATSNTLPVASLTTSFALETLTFSSSVSLTAGTKYWFVFMRTGASSDINTYGLAINSNLGPNAGSTSDFVAGDFARGSTPTTWSTAFTDSRYALYLSDTDSIAKTFPITLSDIGFGGSLDPLTPILDNFDRANENPLSDGGKWSNIAWTGFSSNLRVTSNACAIANSGGSFSGASIWSTSFTNCESYATLASDPGGSVSMAVFGRWLDVSSPSGYYATAFHGGSISLTRLTSGIPTTIGISAGITFGVGDSVMLRCVGSQISVMYKPSGGSWQQAISVTDATYTSGKIGLRISITTGASPTLEDFGGGEPIIDSIQKSATQHITASLEDSGLTIADRFSAANTYSFGQVSPSIQQIARRVTPSADVTVAAASASLGISVGTPTDAVQIQIQTDSAGVPSGTVLATSASVPATSLTGTVATFSLPFASPITLTAGTQYWFVLQRTGSTDSANYYKSGSSTRAVTAEGARLFASWSNTASNLYLNGFSDSIASPLLNRGLTDTGLNATNDSINAVKTGGATQRNITDTGLTETDSLISLVNRALTDTGITNTDTLITLRTHSLGDTGLTNTSTTVTNINRVFSTTGLTNTDSLVEVAVHNRTISDTITISDTLVHAAIRSDSDTGLNLSDTLQKSATKNLTDTGLTVTSTTVTNVTRSKTDTGATVTDSIQKSASQHIADTGATITDSSVSLRNRVFADTGLTVTDATQKSATHFIADTGLTNTDTVAITKFRTDSDTGLTITETLQKSALKNISDTGLTLSDSTVSNRTRVFSDTGLTNTDSIARTFSHNISITDTGATISDSLVTLRLRTDSDTGLTNSDSISRSATHPRTISDTGLTESDSLVHAVIRSDSDTGLNISDSIARTASHNISVSDTGTSASDSTIRLVTHFETDTGLINTDSIARTSSHNISISDTGLTESDTAASKRTRALTDTGLTNTDSIARTASRNISISDTGLTESDTLVHAAIRSDSDTGLNISDTTRKSVSKFVSDTGLTLSDVISTGGHIAIIDTGLSLSDSAQKSATHFISDTGLTLSDTLVSNRNRALADTGLTNTDSISRTAAHNIAASDTGLTLTDALVHLVTRLDADTGLSINDSTSRAASHFRSATDTGLTESDSINSSGGISVSDTGLTLTDSLRKSATKSLSDTGLTETDTTASSRTRAISDTGLTNTDSISRSAVHNIALSDTGLSLSDALAHSIVRSDADTGLTISDAIQKTARHNVSDTGLTNTDSIATSANGAVNLTDTGLTLSDSIARSATHNRSASDTGLTISDSIASAIIKPRTLSDTGLTNSDSIARIATHSRSITDSVTLSDALQHHVFKSDADTGLTISDTLTRGGTAFISDTGLTVSDSITKFASKSISDTGLTLSDSVTNLPVYYRPITDTGLTISDSISAVKLVSGIPITDTALTITDFIQKDKLAQITTSGLSINDSIHAQFIPLIVRGFFKTTMRRDGYYRSYITRLK